MEYPVEMIFFLLFNCNGVGRGKFILTGLSRVRWFDTDKHINVGVGQIHFELIEKISVVILPAKI